MKRTNTARRVKVETNLKRALVRAFPIILFTTILFSIVTFASLVGQLNPTFNSALSLSQNTPWGILTNAFVHSSVDHLSGNLKGAAIFLCYLALLVMLNEFANLKEAIKWMTVGPVVSATCASAVYYILLVWFHSAGSSNGASGIVYAMEGVVVLISLVSTAQSLQRLWNKRDNAEAAWTALANSIVCIPILATIFYSLVDPSLFLGPSSQVNTVIHGLSFVGGLLVMYFLYYLRFEKESLSGSDDSKLRQESERRLQGGRGFDHVTSKRAGLVL